MLEAMVGAGVFGVIFLIMYAILEEAVVNRGAVRMSPDEEFAWIRSTSPGMSDEEIQEIVDLPWPRR